MAGAPLQILAACAGAAITPSATLSDTTTAITQARRRFTAGDTFLIFDHPVLPPGFGEDVSFAPAPGTAPWCQPAKAGGKTLRS
ncbi:hypothetical protein Q0Z83_038450 [Actinoplanes sichuanensis]|nr:hypothetical protein Q0Z83_038450 [Actinoplanes sichuanensis]